MSTYTKVDRDAKVYCLSTINRGGMVDITLYGDANFSAVARYVDTAFMTTYVYVEPPVDTTVIDTTVVGIPDFSILNSQFSIYPNPFRQRVTIQCNETLTAAYLTDLTGRREQVRLVPNGSGRYSLDLAATQTIKQSSTPSHRHHR